MNRRHLLAKTLVAWAMTATPWLHAAEEAPDAWIKRLSTDVLDTIKNDKSLQSDTYGATALTVSAGKARA